MKMDEFTYEIKEQTNTIYQTLEGKCFNCTLVANGCIAQYATDVGFDFLLSEGSFYLTFK